MPWVAVFCLAFGLPPANARAQAQHDNLRTTRMERPAAGLVTGRAPPRPLPLAAPGEKRETAKVRKVAKQFEAVFLTEMLRLARPKDKAASGFSAGESGGTWQVFLDQALGDAAAAKGGTGMGKQIEAAIRHSQARRAGAQRSAP